MAISFTRKGSDGHFSCQGSLQGKAWLHGAHVCQHPAEDDLADAALAQLQNKVVGLGTPDFMGAGRDGHHQKQSQGRPPQQLRPWLHLQPSWRIINWNSGLGGGFGSFLVGRAPLYIIIIFRISISAERKFRGVPNRFFSDCLRRYPAPAKPNPRQSIEKPGFITYSLPNHSLQEHRPGIFRERRIAMMKRRWI